MLTVSPDFLPALSSSHEISVRADVRRGGVTLYSNLPVVDGSMSCSRSRITRRDVDLVIAPRLSTGTYTDRPTLSSDPLDVVGHYGHEITLWWTLHYPAGGSESVPLGTFRIDSVRGSLVDDSTVEISGVSREAYVADARFLSPRTVSGPSAVSLIASLIHEVLPSVEVVASISTDARVPPTVFDEDRWGAITTLAAGLGGVVYADPYGRITVADAPTLESAPVWRLDTSEHGVLVSASTESSREGVYNAVVVRGESPTSDSPPIQAVAYDTSSSSPTRWGDPATGAFGMVPRFMFLPSVTDAAQAERVARAQLARFTGAARGIDLSTVPNPALECGDVIDVVPRDPASTRRHIVDEFAMSLHAGGEFTIVSRDVGAEDAA